MQSFSVFRSLSVFLVVLFSHHTWALTLEENTSGFCSYDGAVQSAHAGATNNQYVNLSNEAGKGITWAVQVAQAGNYTVQFRYANAGTQSATQAAIRVNGVLLAHALPFPKTGAWSSWTNSSAFTLALNAGNNTLRLETTVATEFANIDSLTVHGTGLTAGTCAGAGTPKAPNNGVVAQPQAPVLAAIPAPASGIDMAQPTEGEFNVNASGQATYRLPLVLPAGSGGFAPQISLGYNSGAGNGTLGMGWSLNAGGSVSRCRQSESENRNFRPLTLDANDRFCLNGEKLIVDENYIYGAVGATYKTAIDDFSRITAVGGIAGSPDYFKVEHKDGRIDYYGNSLIQQSSMAKLPYGSANLRWMLTYSEDSAGNRIDYLYEKEHGNWPSLAEIRYAYGNGLPDAKVVFTWDSRPDTIIHRILTAEFQQNVLLYQVEVINNGQSIRKYHLNYDEGNNNAEYDNVSRLSSVTECVGSTCKAPLKFDWLLPDLSGFNNVSETFTLPSASSPFLANFFTYALGDINGDGLLDLVWMNYGVGYNNIYYALAQRQWNGRIEYVEATYVGGTGITATWNTVAMAPPLLKFTDYNHDGRKDLVVTELFGTYRTRIFLSEPQSDGTWKLSASPVPENIPNGLGNKYIFADLNGDGLEDLIRLSGTINVRYLQPGGLGYAPEQEVPVVVPQHLISPHCSSPFSDVHSATGDFNADGRMDFIFIACTAGDPNVARYEQHVYTSHKASNGNVELRFHAKVSNDFSTKKMVLNQCRRDTVVHTELPVASLRVADINNDGYDDISGAVDTCLDNEYRLNWGTGFSSKRNLNHIAYATFNNFIDINGDGYLDAVYVGNSGGSKKVIYVSYWHETAFRTVNHEIPISIDVHYENSVELRDFDGDGNIDFFITGRNYSPRASLYLNKANGKTRNKIYRVVNGLGSYIGITYEAIAKTYQYSYIKGFNPSNTHEFMGMVTSNGLKRKVYAASNEELQDIIRNPFEGTYAGGQHLGDPKFPAYNLVGSYYVVTRSFEQTSGSNDENVEIIHPSEGRDTQYFYENGRFQAGGRGFLGFDRFTKAEYGRLVTINQYRQDWPFTGRLARQEKYNYYTGRLIDKKEYSWGVTQCYISSTALPDCMREMAIDANYLGTSALGSMTPFVFKSVAEKYAMNTSGSQGGIESVTTITREVDSKGNTTYESTAIGNGSTTLHETLQTNTYAYPTYSYSASMGRLTQMQVETNQYGDLGTDTAIRQSSFGYYSSGAAKGLLHYEIIEPNNPDYTIRTDHYYNAFGQRTLSETTADGQTRRSTEYEYDAKGRYVDKTYEYMTDGTNTNTGIKRLVSQVTQRDKYGTPTEIKNYVATNRSVTRRVGTTAFGIPYFTANSDGSFAVITAGINYDPDYICPTGTSTWKKETLSGGFATTQCMDIAGRVIRDGKKGSSDGEWIITDTRYTAEGQQLAKSEPIIHGDDPKYWIITYHDELNRLIYEVKPTREQDGQQATTQIYYENNQVRMVNAKNQERKEVHDPLGRIARVIDANGGTTHFTYDARGNLKTMRDPNNNTTTMTYDLRDRKTSMSDPDKGTWTYRYNRFNEQVCQLDPKQQRTVMHYDIRGRLIARKENYQSNCNYLGGVDASASVSTHWVYDSATNGMGQLAKTYTLLAVAGTQPEYTQRYTYDNWGRLSVTETSMQGHLSQLTTHYEKITYDQYGRIFQVFDAARATDSYEYNGIEHTYTNTGYLFQIKDAVRYGGAQKTYYTIGSVDAHGNRGGSYGNGLSTIVSSYADSGLLKNIITRKSIPGVNLQNSYYTWDLIGNLKTRRETGGGTWIENYLRSRNINESFEYDNLNRLTHWNTSGDFNSTESVTYDAIDNIRTKTGNAAYLYGNQCSSSANAGPHAVCSIGGVNYNYDKSGNMISDTIGRSLQYTIDDLPSQISKNGHTTRFHYGPDRSRFKRVDTTAGSTTTTLYIGNVEKIYRSDNTVEWKRHIGGVAIISQTYNSVGILQSTKEHYLHRDHLGSLSMITDANGFVVKDFYYDPWGASRIPNNDITQWMSAQPFQKVASTISSRGFTNHEHLDEVGLIHMNGRIYDPKLARFVQADPIIQDPLRVQSLNRYSYVWNNPLNATDPSGFTTQGMTRSQLSGDSDDDWAEDPMDIWQLWWDSQAGEDCSASCRSNLRDSNRGGDGAAFMEAIHNAMSGNYSSNSYYITRIGIGSSEGLSTVSVKAFVQWTGAARETQGSSGSGYSEGDSSAQKERTWGSYLPGTAAGDRAAQYWADRLVANGGGFLDDPIASAGLFFSVLWTDQTAVNTAVTLATGGIGTIGSVSIKANTYVANLILKYPSTLRWLPQAGVKGTLQEAGWVAGSMRQSTAARGSWSMVLNPGPIARLQWSAAGGRHGGSYWKLTGPEYGTQKFNYFFSKNW
ncbi:carbohydrate binding protein, putative, cbp35B [Cellvibrio japonicus Ueda107]|uniref:Carbohydrate binding protein, putative, cbp35B n=2 Tax=Cellvibrio japonicus TaxID=155077 RepID=B3PJ48_CELJU|nr:carbohydrate binding protein, putative, cbp35B [Cellvibrio japonicus Ueda107]QEI11249.1 carbohydrate-binding protein [Cellvibrio japonicus]QEI14823.1 carbohydrate-binding protein [Cellvibrio japonicus]QEI18403.1 carbohydrate-binding protein [Cellvibrio japonicus]